MTSASFSSPPVSHQSLPSPAPSKATRFPKVERMVGRSDVGSWRQATEGISGKQPLTKKSGRTQPYWQQDKRRVYENNQCLRAETKQDVGRLSSSQLQHGHAQLQRQSLTGRPGNGKRLDNSFPYSTANRKHIPESNHGNLAQRNETSQSLHPEDPQRNRNQVSQQNPRYHSHPNTQKQKREYIRKPNHHQNRNVSKSQKQQKEKTRSPSGVVAKHLNLKPTDPWHPLSSSPSSSSLSLSSSLSSSAPSPSPPTSASSLGASAPSPSSPLPPPSCVSSGTSAPSCPWKPTVSAQDTPHTVFDASQEEFPALSGRVSEKEDRQDAHKLGSEPSCSSSPAPPSLLPSSSAPACHQESTSKSPLSSTQPPASPAPPSSSSSSSQVRSSLIASKGLPSSLFEDNEKEFPALSSATSAKREQTGKHKRSSAKTSSRTPSKETALPGAVSSSNQSNYRLQQGTKNPQSSDPSKDSSNFYSWSEICVRPAKGSARNTAALSSSFQPPVAQSAESAPGFRERKKKAKQPLMLSDLLDFNGEVSILLCAIRIEFKKHAPPKRIQRRARRESENY